MIDMVELISNTLAPINVPAAFQTYPVGKVLPAQYVTFFEIIDRASIEAGDEELTTERLVQLNIWSQDNYHQLVKSVRSAMEGAGLQRTSAFDALYSDGDSHFNKVLRFVYYDEY